MQSIQVDAGGCGGSISACFPPCSEGQFGWFLKVLVDRREGTMLMCNIESGVYSWGAIGSTATGYFGSDATLFMGAVGGSAPGIYDLLLAVENQSVSTELTVYGGQDVRMSGNDAGPCELEPGQPAVYSALCAAASTGPDCRQLVATCAWDTPFVPGWGSGGFSLQQGGSLSLSYLQIDTAIQIDEGAMQISLDQCVITFEVGQLLYPVAGLVIMMTDVRPSNRAWSLQATGSTYTFAVINDAEISSALIVHADEDVHISGDRTLMQAPTWGSGGFTVADMGSLSLTYLQIGAAIQIDEGAVQLTLDSCVLTFTNWTSKVVNLCC